MPVTHAKDRPSSPDCYPALGPTPSQAFMEAIDPGTQPARLAELARSADWQVRAQVAGRAETPFEVLGLLAHDESPEVVAALAARSDLPLLLLDEILAHPHDGVRAWAAEHPALTPALQAAAGQDPSIQVRLALANRDQLSDRVRRILAADEARVVRAAVLAHPGTPRWIWRKGVRDPAPGNRILLLERDDLSPGSILALAADSILYQHPGADQRLERALIQVLQTLQPRRRRRCTTALLMSASKPVRELAIRALRTLTETSGNQGD